MFTLWGSPRPDRVTRRDFLRVGALGFGGLTLADVLRLRAENPTPRKARAVIMITLPGGPSHLDMYDLKPDAPADIRGDFKPIRTNVAGFDICEHFPRQATIADKLAVVRTVQWIEPMQHELQEIYSGFPKSARRPAFGSFVSRLKPNAAELPTYVSLDEYEQSHHEVENPHYLGAAHRPFLYGQERIRTLSLQRGITPDNLSDRRRLTAAFDSMQRDVDARGEAGALDEFSSRAAQIILSPRARAAFDLNLEPVRVRDRYGFQDKFTYGNDPTPNLYWGNEKFLLARRLVEAGVSVVTLRVGTWDYHGTTSGTGNIFTGLKTQLPLLDRSIHALITDLHERGLDKEVAVLIWGEFGRTPRINKVEGRDHWPDCGYALFAGGGLKMGQVIGESDSKAERPRNRPFTAQDVLATVYHTLGIDLGVSVPDFSGRPMKILDDGKPIEELI
jgi:hypothetical protein